MKANSDKFQFMIFGPSDDKCFILKINAIEIRDTSYLNNLALQSIINWSSMLT